MGTLLGPQEYQRTKQPAFGISPNHREPYETDLESLRTPDRFALTWMVSHDEYATFKKMMQKSPQATPAELRTIKHPYYLSFQYVMGTCLKYKNTTRTQDELIQVFFDCDMDNHDLLKAAFKQWIEVVRLNDAHLLKQLVNKEAESRDDAKHPELQAADLLAYHLRRFVYEISQLKNLGYADVPTWKTLSSTKIEQMHHRYESKQWAELAGRVLQPFSPFLPIQGPIVPTLSRR